MKIRPIVDLGEPFVRVPVGPHGKYALVDREDVGLVKGRNWSLLTGYARSYSEPRVYMQRVILGLTDPQIQADHWNLNKLDNRRANLRLATNAENGRNRDAQCNNTSGCKGVSWYKRGKCFRAQIKLNNRNIFLGLFDDLEEARAAYNAASLALHREFGRPA